MKEVLARIFDKKNIAIAIAVYVSLVGVFYYMKPEDNEVEYFLLLAKAKLWYYLFVPSFGIFAYQALCEFEKSIVDFKKHQEGWELFNMTVVAVFVAASFFVYQKYSMAIVDLDLPHVDETISCNTKNLNTVECGEYSFVFSNTIEYKTTD